MSSPSNPDDYSQLAKDSVIASALGAAGMVSRILLSEEKLTLGWIVRRTLAASIVSVLVGFALQDQVQSLTMRFAAIGLAGASAPEVLDSAIAYAKKRMGAEVKKAGGKTNAKPKRNKRK
ncbi:hypothetical protein UFOVP340_32 [uncultured Caudovirales phage]|uniref:Uncharacterized protein n=1 Tax=uncultured Caudovirales phage TaxID=2100421 RepID=A0A6J5LZN1_9CAUD|nr:hypothetical protein UFOVP340_32 [uncultured Caudovirales phage]